VTPILVALAAVVTGGGALAASAREPRLAALGTILALAGSGYVADPLPGAAALAVRLAGSVLAGYLVWIALRSAPAPLPGRALGWPGAGAIAILAFTTGWLVATSLGAALVSGAPDGPSGGVATALAAGSPVARAALGSAFALVVLAAGPVLLARDVLRLVLGLLLLVAAAGLVRNAFAATPDAFVELAIAVLVALAGAAGAAVIAASVRRTGDLEIRPGGAVQTAAHHRGADEAHRRPAR
jgi:hypothetical protein